MMPTRNISRHGVSGYPNSVPPANEPVYTAYSKPMLMSAAAQLPITLDAWNRPSTNLSQGLSLIEKAVSLRPDDGYIVDSLGWAYFKLGDFKESVKYLERAVELRPDDPTLNDHLGDALWRVGRSAEARFQWDQALSLKPDPEDIDKIKVKLEKGLPAKTQAKAPVKTQIKTKQAASDPPRNRAQVAPKSPVKEPSVE